MKGNAIRRIESGRDCLDLFLSVLVGDCVDAVEQARAGIDVAFVVDPQ